MSPEPIPIRSSPAEATPLDDRFRRQVDDADTLLAFATSNGRSVDEDALKEIGKAVALVSAGGSITPEARAIFDKAYATLSGALAPVTIETLRATDDAQGRRFWSRVLISEARIWSRKLMILSGLVATFILFSENIGRILLDEDQGRFAFGTWHSRWVIASGVLQSLTPFAYGVFGACAYLLRSCHEFIHKREFNSRYIPEYFTRMLLGGVSGAAILMFTEAMATGNGAVKISASASAFIAGYSNDFLFNFIERVVGALMPKTANASSPAAGDSTTELTGK